MYSLYSFLIYDTILIYGGVLSMVKKEKEKRTTTMFQEDTLVPDVGSVGLDVSFRRFLRDLIYGAQPLSHVLPS